MRVAPRFQLVVLMALSLAACNYTPTQPETVVPAETVVPGLPASGYTLSGRVTESNRQPLAGVTVTIRPNASTAPNPRLRAITDAFGRYALTGVSGTVFVSFARDGFEGGEYGTLEVSSDTSHDFTMQRRIALNAGDTFEDVIYREDGDWIIDDFSDCAPCRVIRLRPAGRPQRIQVDWEDKAAGRGLWVGTVSGIVSDMVRVCCGSPLQTTVMPSLGDVLLFIEGDRSAPPEGRRFRLVTTQM